MTRLLAGKPLINVTEQENPLWRLSSFVKHVDRIMPDDSVQKTAVNKARFTVLGVISRLDTGEVVHLCEFYSNALDGDKFFLTPQFIGHWDALVERA